MKLAHTFNKNLFTQILYSFFATLLENIEVGLLLFKAKQKLFFADDQEKVP